MEQLLKYNKGGGKELKGLTLRRKDEVALFRKE
jgi:GH24 family phage-related lysozyme (muramidase)